ncbi:MAG: arsenic resistance N-acetyltransferase ArsN2 [Pseudomonadota bacterium]
MPGEISRLSADDLNQLENLLKINNLPTKDCAGQVHNYYALYEHQKLIAAGGLEPAGSYQLLRSLVVDPQRRGGGLGAQMTEFLIAKARDAGCPAIYLLTETARDYFLLFGFREIERAQVPDSIKETRQFSELCPDSAICMVLQTVR